MDDLLKRVEAATADDTKELLNCAVDELLDVEAMEPVSEPFAAAMQIVAFIECGAFTDAALGLVERVLPGIAVSLDGLVGDEQRPVHHHPDNVPSAALDALVDAAKQKLESRRWTCELHNFISPSWHERGDAPTPALAILAALLRAKAQP